MHCIVDNEAENTIKNFRNISYRSTHIGWSLMGTLAHTHDQHFENSFESFKNK